MAMAGYVDYQRREYCHAVDCPIQKLLDQCEDGSDQYEEVRALCKTECIHTTYEFHHWLAAQGYEIVRLDS